MAHEKQYTAKQAAFAVLEKVGEMLKKSEALNADLTKANKGDDHAFGKWAAAAKKAAPKSAPIVHEQAFKRQMRAARKPPAAPQEEEEFKCEKCETIYKAESKHEKCEDHKMEKSELESELENLKTLFKYEPENSKKLGYKLSQEGKEERQPEASDHAFDVKSGKQSTSPDPRLAQQKDPQHNAKEQAEGNNELAGTTPTQVGQDGKNKPGGDEIKGHLKLAKFVGRMDYKRQTKQNQAQVASQEHVGNAQAASSAQHSESIRNK